MSNTFAASAEHEHFNVRLLIVECARYEFCVRCVLASGRHRRRRCGLPRRGQAGWLTSAQNQVDLAAERRRQRLQRPVRRVRLAVLEVVEDRYGNRSTIITSQLPPTKWHEYLGDPTVADAIRTACSTTPIDSC
jgi:hypothetical protein